MPQTAKPLPHLPRLIVDDSLTWPDIEQLIVRLDHENRELLARNEEMRRQATHDPLTGLPNRLLFEDRVEAAIRRAQRSRQAFALAYTDLDGFKAVNDEHGHAAGDELIRFVGQRLGGALRASDSVARLGGDEFGVLIEMLDAPGTALKIGEKLHRALVEPMTLHSALLGRTVQVAVGASIGIALYPDHAGRVRELFNRADAAMYAAKRAGGGVRVFAPDRRTRADGTVRPLRDRRRAPPEPSAPGVSEVKRRP